MRSRTHKFYTLTKRLYSFSFLAAGFAAGLTADVVKSEKDVMFLMHVDWKLNLNLPKEKQCTKLSKHTCDVCVCFIGFLEKIKMVEN